MHPGTGSIMPWMQKLTSTVYGISLGNFFGESVGWFVRLRGYIRSFQGVWSLVKRQEGLEVSTWIAGVWRVPNFFGRVIPKFGLRLGDLSILIVSLEISLFIVILYWSGPRSLHSWRAPAVSWECLPRHTFFKPLLVLLKNMSWQLLLGSPCAVGLMCACEAVCQNAQLGIGTAGSSGTLKLIKTSQVVVIVPKRCHATVADVGSTTAWPLNALEIIQKQQNAVSSKLAASNPTWAERKSIKVVEFDIERDHHRKGAKNRLVARCLGSEMCEWDLGVAAYQTKILSSR